MLSIGEFSKACGLTVKTLRFYHERGILTPAAVDPQSGYRYYNDRNLETAQVIRALRDLEFSLDDIQIVLAQSVDDQEAIEHLARHRASLAKKMSHYQDLLFRLDQVIAQERLYRKEINMRNQTFEVQEKSVEPLLVAGFRMRGRYRECGEAFGKLAKRVGRLIAGKPLMLCYDSEYRDEDADFEPCFPLRKELQVEDIHIRTLPLVRCVSLQHRGPYDTLGSSYAKALEYVKEKDYELELPTREVYLKGPGMIFRGNPKKYLTEIQLPIKQ